MPEPTRRRSGAQALVLLLAAGALALAASGIAGEHHHGDQDEGPASSPAEPASVWTLEDLEGMALELSPTLSQSEAAVHAAKGRELQAGLYPNPTIGYEGDEISGPASGGEHGGFVAQRIVTGGKLRLAQAVSAEASAEAEARRDTERLRVLNGVRRLYYEVLGAEAVLELRRELDGLGAEALDVTRQLLNVGQADRPDVLAAEIEAEQAHLTLDGARSELEKRRRQLAAAVGSTEVEARRLGGHLEGEIPDLTFETALDTIEGDSPELRLARIAASRARATVTRAKVDPLPDLTVTGAVRYNFERFAPGNERIGPEGFAQIGVALPIFDRNQGTIAAAVAEVRQNEREVERVRMSLRSRLADAFSEYETSRKTVEVYREKVLPAARQAYDLYLARHREMTAAYPQALVARRAWLQARVETIGALVRVWRNVVGIRGLLVGERAVARAEEAS